MYTRLIDSSDAAVYEALVTDSIFSVASAETFEFQRVLVDPLIKFYWLIQEQNQKIIGFVCFREQSESTHTEIVAFYVIPRFDDGLTYDRLLEFTYAHILTKSHRTARLVIPEKRLKQLCYFVENGFKITEIITSQDSIDKKFALTKAVKPVPDLRVNAQTLRHIQEGTKSLECRLNYKFVQQIKAGDKVSLFNPHLRESALRLIHDVRRYTSLEDLLAYEELARLDPEVTTIEESLTKYQRIFPEHKVQKTGGLTVFDFCALS